MDLALYNLTGQYINNISRISVSEITATAAPDDPVIYKRLEVITNKVVKYLLTYKGSDAFDPEYGSTAFHRRVISENLLPEITSEFFNDISRCETYLKEKEKDLDISTEKIASITLDDIVYDRETSPYSLNVFIVITTNYGNKTKIKVKSSE